MIMKDLIILRNTNFLQCERYSIKVELPLEHASEYICLLSRMELKQAIDVIKYWHNDRLPESCVLGPRAPYTCFVEGQYYYPCGWSGENRGGTFSLLECYWLLKKYNPAWSFTRGRHLRDYGDWKRPTKPAIESLKDDDYSYYLDKDISTVNDTCFQCKAPLWEHAATLHEVWFEWWRYGERLEIKDRQIDNIKDKAPEWLHYMQKVCSIQCYEKLQIRSGRLIKERIDTWINQVKEVQRIKRLRKINLAARKSLRSGDRAALKSLKEEYEQEVTLPN